jgi:glycine/D-amino acid oxidase-like deaminating enzyme
MQNLSYWEIDFITTKPNITIIGAGIVGLSTAISIAESNPALKIKIFERGTMPYGASTKNAGFCCFGSISEILDDISFMGVDRTIELVKMRYAGLKKLVNRVGHSKMLYASHETGLEVFRQTDTSMMEKCLDNIQYCNDLLETHLGIKDTYKITKAFNLYSFKEISIENKYEATINPVMMMNNLYQKAINLGIDIHYNVVISSIDIENHVLKTTKFDLPFDKLIVCTNGFTRHLLPKLSVYPARNQVLITKRIPNLKLNHGYHLDKGYVYFRSYQDRILLGGGRNIGGEAENTDSHGNTQLVTDYLTQILDELYPGASQQIDHYWSGILGIGPEKFPLCQWVHEDVLVGVRMGGMGIAIGSYIGEILADMISNK